MIRPCGTAASRRGRAASLALAASVCLSLAAGAQPAPEARGAGVPQHVPPRQFLYRPTTAYRNYAFEDYRLPETSFYARTNYYGPMGNLLINGYDLYRWSEIRANAATSQVPNSVVSKSGRFGAFKYTAVAKESYKDWATSFIVGDDIRTVFTPLTMRWAGVNGVRLDAVYRHTSMALFGSRPTSVPGGSGGEQRNMPLMSGGHIEHEFGALRVGATVLNHHLFDSRQDEFDFRGELQAEQPQPGYLIVRFRDDSPLDETGGPVISQVRLKVNGEERPDLRPTLVRMSSRNPTALGRTNRVTGQFLRTVYRDEGTKYVDYLYLQRHLAGESVRNVNLDELVRWIEIIPPGQELAADGEWVIQAYFDLRAEEYVQRVEVEVLVGNDYRIDVLGIYDSDPRQFADESRWRIGGVEGEARAEGNIQDLSNYGWVHIDVGAYTGRAVFGVNASWEWGNASIRAEAVRSVDYRRYPDGPPDHRDERSLLGVKDWQGERTSTRDKAYYVAGDWQGERWGVGGEIYHMGPNFHRGMPIPAREDPASIGERAPPHDGFVEDNDDNDRWPDRGAGEYRQGHHGGLFTDPDGVFPGNDADHDGIPDTNRNQNSIPDYDESFLLYDVEPDMYVYGRDWNHNGVVDEREDDELPDYPYRIDTRGAHLFGRMRLLDGLWVTLGRHAGEGVAGGGRNDADYLQVLYQQGDPSWGRVRFENLLERVCDDIVDDYRIFEEVLDRPIAGGGFIFRGARGYNPVDVADRLEWRDSWERQHYLEGEWRPGRSARLYGNVRYSVNYQQGGLIIEGRDLGKDQVHLFSAVLKGEYVWEPARGWQVTAQTKGMRLRRKRDTATMALIDEWTVIPIAKVRCTLTPRTELWLGTQGLPGLPMRRQDRTDGFNSREEQVRIVQLTNRSGYLGYEIVTTLGWKSTLKDYDDPARELDDMDVTSVFLRVLLGFVD